jgi:hypothetical protein
MLKQRWVEEIPDERDQRSAQLKLTSRGRKLLLGGSLVAHELAVPGSNPFGREATVWSAFGAGYLLIPLALPILGILWLRSQRAAVPSSKVDAASNMVIFLVILEILTFDPSPSC